MRSKYFGLKVFHRFNVEMLLLNLFKPVLLILLNRSVTARRFTADCSTKYHHEAYHPEHK